MGGVSTVVLAVPGFWGWARPPLKQGVLARPALLSMLGGPEPVGALGRRYRAAHPEEDSREVLVAALHEGIDPGPSSALRARLERQVRADFAAGHTVQLEGWVLAVTEARQCALYSIMY